MNKIIISFPNKKKYDFYTQDNIDGFFIGIEGFSENFNYYVKESKLKEVITTLNKNNKNAYIMLNKVIMNDKIDDLKELLIKISKLDVYAVIFSDIAIFNIVKENNLNINLIWSSKMVTNSKTINFYEKRGIYGYMPTPQITIDEIEYIIKNTNKNPIVKLFGYTNMATSSRSLITNYLKYINKEDKSSKYYMYEKTSKEFYPIVEEDNTNFFSSKILNGILEYKKLINDGLDFSVYLDDYLIPETQFYNVVEAFIALKNHPDDDEFSEKLKKVVDSNMFNNTDNGFLNKKTIFKVK